MRLICAVCIGLFLFMFRLVSQDVSVSVSNSLQYGTGKERTLFDRGKKDYLENLTDLRLFIGDFTVGFRFEYSNPPEYGIPFRGINRKYIEFERNGLSIRAGDLYALFSRGLALNLFENRTIGFNTGLEGGRVQYQNDFLNVKLLGGEIDYVEPLTIEWREPHRERYTLGGAYTEVKPWRRLSLGSSFMLTKAEIPTPFPDRVDKVNTRIVDSFMRLRHSLGDLYVGYAFRTGNVNDTEDLGGGGMYVSLSHTGSNYGVTLEYKDYRFDVVNPLDRSFLLRPTRMLPFQNPPTVHKGHSYMLMSRFPRVVDFNDEVGLQVDVVGTLTPNIFVNLNYSTASRHYSYTLDNVTFEVEETKSGVSWLPSFADERSPYNEIYVDMDYYFADFASFIKVGFNSRSEFFYELIVPEISERRRLTTLLLEMQYAFNPMWSSKLTTEFQRVYDSINFDNDRYYNQFVAIQVSRAPFVTFGLRYEFTTNRGEPDGIRNWFVVDAGVRIGSHSNLGISYGGERGGVVCVNGICRTVKAYEGLRLFLTTTI
jgi:hypothetical protein